MLMFLLEKKCYKLFSYFLGKRNEYFGISEKNSFFKNLPRGKQIFYYIFTVYSI